MSIVEEEINALTRDFTWLDLPSIVFCLKIVATERKASTSSIHSSGGVIDAGVIHVCGDKSHVSGSDASLRIVCVSDTHCLHEQLPSLPQADVLIHAGGKYSNTNTASWICRNCRMRSSLTCCCCVCICCFALSDFTNKGSKKEILSFNNWSHRNF